MLAEHMPPTQEYDIFAFPQRAKDQRTGGHLAVHDQAPLDVLGHHVAELQRLLGSAIR